MDLHFQLALPHKHPNIQNGILRPTPNMRMEPSTFPAVFSKRKLS